MHTQFSARFDFKNYVFMGIASRSFYAMKKKRYNIQAKFKVNELNEISHVTPHVYISFTIIFNGKFYNIVTG